jgi:hypothetical protein
LDPELVDFGYEELRKPSEDWAGGGFGPAKEPADESKQSMLLALTGR